MPWNRFTNQEGLVYIASASPSAASTSSINSCFSSSYKNYRIMFSLKAAAGTPELYFKLRSGSTDTSGSQEYVYSNTRASSSAVQAGGTSGWVQTTAGFSYFHIGAISTVTSITTVDIASPQLSDYTNANWIGNNYDTVTANYAFFGGGIHKQQIAYDGITVATSASTFTGYVAVYGYTE